jgi:hypothetical protein
MGWAVYGPDGYFDQALDAHSTRGHGSSYGKHVSGHSVSRGDPNLQQRLVILPSSDATPSLMVHMEQRMTIGNRAFVARLVEQVPEPAVRRRKGLIKVWAGPYTAPIHTLIKRTRPADRPARRCRDWVSDSSADVTSARRTSLAG